VQLWQELVSGIVIPVKTWRTGTSLRQAKGSQAETQQGTAEL
jgi:hypothetical protein